MAFLSGKTGKELPFPDEKLKEIDRAFTPLALHDFSREKAGEKARILFAAMKRTKARKDILVFSLMGEGFFRKKEWVSPLPLGGHDPRGAYEGIFDWKDPESFPLGVVLADFEGDERFVFFSMSGSKEEGAVKLENGIIPRPGRWFSALGPMGPGGVDGLGVFFFEENEESFPDHLVFCLVERPSFHVRWKKRIPTYTATDGYWPHSVLVLGDLDNDSFQDVWLGSPFNLGNNEELEAGCVQVFSGKNGKLLLTIRGKEKEDEFGLSTAALDDLDGDGVKEFAVGAPGYICGASMAPGHGYVGIYSGRTGKELCRVEGGGSGDCFGVDLAYRDGLLFVGVGVPVMFGPIRRFQIFRVQVGGASPGASR